MKTIIAGSRSITDYAVIVNGMQNLAWEVTEVVSGTARGVDRLGERWARDHFIPVKQFPADWNRYARAAGVMRNRFSSFVTPLIYIFYDWIYDCSNNRNT